MSIYHRKHICWCWAGLSAGGMALLLAGCGPNEAEKSPLTGDIATADAGQKEGEAPAIDSDMAADKVDTAPSDKAANTMAEQASSGANFPEKFQGRWAVNVADCSKARGMETTVMIIDGKSVQFYESMASLKSAMQSGDTLNATLGWTGEGQNWDGETVFTLKDGGKRLTRSDADLAEALIYKKCPA